MGNTLKKYHVKVETVMNFLFKAVQNKTKVKDIRKKYLYQKNSDNVIHIHNFRKYLLKLFI